MRDFARMVGCLLGCALLVLLVPSASWSAVVPPDAPTGLVVTAEGSEDVSLAWSAPAGGVTPEGYEVRVDGGTPVALGDVLTTTVPGLTPDTTYLFEVRSYAAAEFSAWASVSGTTAAAPAPVTGAGTQADPTIVRLDDESTSLLLLTACLLAVGIGARVVGSFGGR